MAFSITPSILITVLTLAIFLCILNFSLWYTQGKEKAPLWLSFWLATCIVFLFARLLQYFPFEPAVYRTLPRTLLSASYVLAWISYEFTNSFVGFKPRRRERIAILALTGISIFLLWASQLILTNEIVLRVMLNGESFHGVLAGPLYLPVDFLVLLIGIIAPVRLLRSPTADRRENQVMALGFFFVILFSVFDFGVTFFSLISFRLSDYSYLPAAIFFSYFQVRQSRHLYQDMNILVQERTAELSQANETLKAEIIERQQTEEKIKQNAARMTVLYETTRDLVIERELTQLLHTIMERVVGMIGATGGGLYLCDPEKREVRCVVSYNTIRDYTGVILKYGEGAAGQVAATGEPLMIDDYRVWSKRAAVYEEDRPFLSLLSVPMRWQDRIIGVIHVLDNYRVAAFGPEDLRVATLFANHAAIAIENSRLFEAEQDRRREVAVISEVSRDISANLQLDVVLDKIADHAKELLRAETSAVYLYDPANSMLRAIAACGPDADEIKQDPVQIGEGILGNIALQKTGEIVNDAASDPRAVHISGTTVDIAYNLMGMPVLPKENLTGLIAVWRRGDEPSFRQTDLDFLRNLAGQVGVAIENARLFEYIQSRLAELEILQTIASALRIAQTLDEALPIILELLIRLLHLGGASLELLHPETEEIVTELACGKWSPVTGLRTPANVGVSSQVMASGQPYMSVQAVSDGLIARLDLIGGLNTVVCVPISAQHQPIGVIWIGRQSQVAFTGEEVKLMTALGEMVGNTIHRMKLHEQTERQTEEIISAYDMTLEGWAKALELRDKETEGHSRRVTEITIHLAQKLGILETDLPQIRRGVLLHDIGKLGISDQVLKKNGPLNDLEWEEMRKHPQYAYDLIYPITYLRPAVDIPYNHHEHWDGSGYPNGLKMEEIPLSARIFAVVDVYDALCSDRSYRTAWPKSKVIEYIKEQAGKHFDPNIVNAFLELYKNGEIDKRSLSNANI